MNNRLQGISTGLIKAGCGMMLLPVLIITVVIAVTMLIGVFHL